MGKVLNVVAGAATGFFTSGGNPLGAIAGGIGGLASSEGVEKSADAQAAAAQSAQDTQYRIYQEQTALQEPFRQGGLTAQNRLLDLLGLSQNNDTEGYGSLMRDFNTQDFKQDPGYAFRLSEGLKSLDRQAAARGGLISGAALKAAQRYGQNEASNEYQNAFNRFQVNRSNKLNPLQSLMGSGQTATGAISNNAGEYGRSAGDAIYNAGAARASGYVGGANALTNAIGQGFNAYQNNQILNRLFAGQNGYNSGGISSSIYRGGYDVQ